MTEEEEKERCRQIQEIIVNEINRGGKVSDDEILESIEEHVLRMGHTVYLPAGKKDEMIRAVFNSIRKLDVLQEILEDSSITEIMVNGPNHIFIEKGGRLQPYPKTFSSRDKLEDVVQQIVGKVNRRVNEANPIADVRLLDGSRVNVVLPPIALDGPVVTIRKFPDKLKKLVKAKYNFFISGGTGSGKTTFLNALSEYIPSEERLIVIEDAAELQIRGIPNLVRLEVRNANLEGKNAVTIRDLMKSALRMRPDRIVLGEVRDAAACELLNVMNTGHDGSLCSGHANSPKDMLSRLETLVLTGMDIPLLAVRSQIASAIDIIVHLGRLRDKSRKVLEIDEVIGMQQGEIQIKPLFHFREEGQDGTGQVMGKLCKTEHSLFHQEKLYAAGISI